MKKWWRGGMTEMKGPLIKIPHLTFYVGLELRSFRWLYFRLTKKYWWGINQFSVDFSRRQTK